MARGFRLWIEEADKKVWHWAMRPVGKLQYIAACGWEMTARHTMVWPQKSGDPGPPHGQRCHTCAGIDAQSIDSGQRSDQLRV